MSEKRYKPAERKVHPRASKAITSGGKSLGRVAGKALKKVAKASKTLAYKLYPHKNYKDGE